MDERSTRKVPIEEIEMDHRCQARAEVSHDAVTDYAEAYRSGATLPPPEVFLVSGKLYLVDGYHRVPAAIQAGVGFLRVVIVGEGTMDDAIWYATGVNQGHGVRRSNADKRRAVWMALESPIGQEQSNRVIAEHCGVSHVLVSGVRKEWEARQVATVTTCDSDGIQVEEPASPRRRVGKDGKSYPAKPRAARKPPAEPTPPASAADEGPLPFEPEYVPPTALPMPDYGPALLGAARRVREARLFALRSVPEHNSLVGARQRFEENMRQAQAALDLAVPVLCPHGCNGAGCVRCGNAGWLAKGTAAR